MRYFVLIIFICLLFNSYSQCPNNGQNPSSAFPVCGSQTFTQGIVPTCEPGRQMAIPNNVCGGGSGLNDVNPFYYKFTAFVAGPLEFSITPNRLSDDYDWQLHDITGKNPNAVYTDASTFVACNWSGNTGITGTNLTSTTANGCAGAGIPLFTRAPNLIAGHEYLLMVSHFDPVDQSGYTLSFSTASASLITDIKQPALENVFTSCNSKEVAIKLNKKILCSSLASDLSDFSSNATIVAASGFGCNRNFDTDSIIVVLDGNTQQGNYFIGIKTGSDGNTLLDYCNNQVANNISVSMAIFNKPNPDFTFTNQTLSCSVDTVLYSHNGNSGTTNWQWTFDGIPSNSNLQNPQVVYNSFVNRIVKLVVNNDYCKDSIIKNIPIVDRKLTPIINATDDTTCPNISQTFTSGSLGNNITSYFWDFNNGQTYNFQSPPSQTFPILPTNKVYKVKLKLTNGFNCVDSIYKDILVWGTIPTEFDSIIPPTCQPNQVQIYFKQDMNCSSVATDGSDFELLGAAGTNITAANIFCPTGVGKIVTLTLNNSLTTGAYSIALKTGSDGNTIINDCGIETLPKTVSFNALSRINAIFSHTVKYGCLADTFSFNHNINNLSNKWNWSFVDGNPNVNNSNIQNPTVIYSNVTDSHTIKLVVSNGTCIDSSIQKIGTINHQLKAGFLSADTTCGGALTNFTDTSKGLINKWIWQFDQIATSNLQNPTNIQFPLLNVFKNYSIKLKIWNTVNCVDSIEKFIVVRPASPAKILKLSYDKCGTDSLLIYFNFPMVCNSLANNGSDFVITGPEKVVISSAYIKDCNSNGLGKIVVLKLQNPINTNGDYSLQLVRGTDGNTILNDCNIETPLYTTLFLAFGKPNATFSSNIILNCIADTLKLQNNDNKNIKEWKWSVNGVLQNQTPQFYLAYNKNASYKIILIAKNEICFDTASNNYTLEFNEIEAKFFIDKEVVCPNESVSFFNTSRGNFNYIKWSLGDGDTSNSYNINDKKYKLPLDRVNPNTGNTMLTGDNFNPYTINLTIRNDKGCTDNFSLPLKVTSNCLVKVPSAFTPNGDGLNDFLYPLNAYKASNLKFRVFDRWGKLVFESTNMNDRWDGNSFSKSRMPSGTYIWTLVYFEKDTGIRVSTKGTTILIR